MPDDTAPGSGSQRVLTDVADGIATIILNDPSRRNSVTPELSIAVEAACRQIAADRNARVVILTGAGSAFSAGGDIGSLSDAAQAGTAASLRTVYRGFEALATLTVPTLAAVNGPSVGAGMNFALACDVIIAAESARFDPRFLDIGIHPGGGHLWRLQARAGRQAAAALVLFGDLLTGQQAADCGLAWACVPDSDLLAKARELGGRAARRSPELVRRAKATLNASVPITNARDATDLELIAQRWSMSRPAFRDGVAALQRQLAERRAGSPKLSPRWFDRDDLKERCEANRPRHEARRGKRKQPLSTGRRLRHEDEVVEKEDLAHA